ncbi:sirohydrochlorin chelatase [Nocardioides panacihumi]|uniref:sirohydrochlorin chelatase n=1 Tax=Nocardioides panacihumi TaxID=400774 RepID=UPI0031E3A7CA
MTVAHGTRHAAGNRVAAEITRRAGERLGVDSRVSYVELCAPLFADVVASGDEPMVAVPLLLSRGHHVAVDLPAAARGAAGAITVTPPLGPHPLLARAQSARLIEAGAAPGDPVVMIAAGSQDARAEEDLRASARLLGAVWGTRVRVAVLSGTGPRPEEVLAVGDAVSPYLLAPGHFADRARTLALSFGAAVVAEPIGVHPLVVDLVVERARVGGYTEVPAEARV